MKSGLRLERCSKSLELPGRRLRFWGERRCRKKAILCASRSSGAQIPLVLNDWPARVPAETWLPFWQCLEVELLRSLWTVKGQGIHPLLVLSSLFSAIWWRFKKVLTRCKRLWPGVSHPWEVWTSTLGKPPHLGSCAAEAHKLLGQSHLL